MPKCYEMCIRDSYIPPRASYLSTALPILGIRRQLILSVREALWLNRKLSEGDVVGILLVPFLTNIRIILRFKKP